MKGFRYSFILLLLFAVPSVLFAVQTGPSDDVLRRSFVRIRISSLDYSHTRPWTMNTGRSRRVTGLVVEGNRIVVPAGEIRNAGLLEVTSFSSYAPIIAKVERIDMEANLALLRLEDESLFASLKPLPFGEDPSPGEKVRAIRIDDRFRVFREEPSIQEVETAADYGFTHVPVYVFRTDENFDGGGVLMKDGKISGLVQFADSAKKNEAFPISVISTFVSENYKGFVSHGFVYRDLVDPVFRQYTGLDPKGNGVMILGVLPGTSSWGVLHENDVLLSIDGVTLDPRGYYEDPLLGRQSAPMLMVRSPKGKMRTPGDVIQLKIIREGKPMELKATLRSYEGNAERIPWLVDGRPDYRIENGLVFQELTVPYLREAFGSSWKRRTIEYSFLYSSDRYYKIPTDDRIVILSRVLPGEANRDFERLTGRIVKEVEHKPVRNLKEMKSILDQAKAAGTPYVEVLMQDKTRLYLNLIQGEEINRELLERYGVPADDASDLDRKPQGS